MYVGVIQRDSYIRLLYQPQRVIDAYVCVVVLCQKIFPEFSVFLIFFFFFSFSKPSF